MPDDRTKIAAGDRVASRPTPISIPIVDDEPKNLTVLEAILESPDYRLVRAEPGEQALLALLDGDFALLSFRMRGMTGFELAQAIRERKKTANIPIIFLTRVVCPASKVLEKFARHSEMERIQVAVSR
jgi:CheY-like chemotaxis protein